MTCKTYTAVVILLAQICARTNANPQEVWNVSITTFPEGPVLEGSNVTLTCAVNSDPPSGGWLELQHRFWYRTTTVSDEIYAATSHNFELEGVLWNQTGWYLCYGRQNFEQWPRSSNLTPVMVHYRPTITNKDRTWIGAEEMYTATLECVIRGNPQPTVIWYGLNGTIITATNGSEEISLKDVIRGDGVVGYLVKSRLTIDSVKPSKDYGMYRCRASNNIGSYDEHEIQLTKTGKPEPPRILSPFYVSRRSISATFVPGYDGGERLQSYFVNIRKIPGEFDPRGWKRHNQNDTHLSFDNLKPGAQYQIAMYATNAHGSSPHGTVTVWTYLDTPFSLGIDVSYSRAQERFVVTGVPQDNDTATCLRITGNNYTMYGWKSLGSDLDCIQHDGVFPYTGLSYRMKCNYCRDDVCSSPNRIYDWDVTMTMSPPGPVVEGTEVLLTCIINREELDSKLTLWQFSRDQISSTNLNRPTYERPYTNLTLGEVYRNQSGWYRCAWTRYAPPSNWKPSAYSEWTAVAVFYRPEITSEGRTWIGVNENQSATFECVILGNPLPKVTWYGANGIAISNNTDPGRVYLEDTITGDDFAGFLIKSQVTIFPVQSTDYGIYTCRAANHISQYDKYEIQLNKTGKPEAPKDLRAYYFAENEIQVVWAPGYDGGETLEFYYINIRVIPREFDLLGWNELNPDRPHDHFSDLEHDTLYQVAVYAKNRHGSGPYATVDKRTKPNAPSLMGITVSYSVAERTLFVAGMPEGSNAGTCLQLMGFDAEHNDWVSLRPDLDCVQHDGEFQYSGQYGGHLHCRYCRDGLCGKESHIAEVNPSTTPAPQSALTTEASGRNGEATWPIILASCCGCALLVAFIVCCYRRKWCCVKTTSSDCAEYTTQPNTTVEETHPLKDVPPTYLETTEMQVIADDGENQPPTRKWVPCSLQQQTRDGEEHCV
ncbi:neural cell adhesion molecule 2-like isoform X2 [Acanthaster planci]|uniref:Neural cell adhesion molecule 2-like isoform X2 n=1 Tax=Acanthaster planci TaxID=133434 RepID=A0A8B7ZXB4_ACAPL|nr:neural cell adhesion molecule 2-like isoform X2 [Acanthaster planci]